jgi:hypothetical protein
LLLSLFRGPLLAARRLEPISTANQLGQLLADTEASSPRTGFVPSSCTIDGLY